MFANEVVWLVVWSLDNNCSSKEIDVPIIKLMKFRDGWRWRVESDGLPVDRTNTKI